MKLFSGINDAYVRNIWRAVGRQSLFLHRTILKDASLSSKSRWDAAIGYVPDQKKVALFVVNIY